MCAVRLYKEQFYMNQPACAGSAQYLQIYISKSNSVWTTPGQTKPMQQLGSAW